MDKKIEQVPIKIVNMDEKYETMKENILKKNRAYLEEMVLSDQMNLDDDFGMLGRLKKISPMTFWYLVMIAIIFIAGGLLTVAFTIVAVDKDAIFRTTQRYEDLFMQ